LNPRRILSLLLFSAFALLIILAMQPLEIFGFRDHIAVLFPAGMIASKQLNLLLIIQGVMLIVVIPVFILTYIFSWKYRASNKNAQYDPDFDHHHVAEYIWWGIPLIIVTIIGVLTWIRTHELDPYRPIASETPPITIQAVALQWKWLFIYPNEGIASLNFIQIPEKTPIHFEITERHSHCGEF